MIDYIWNVTMSFEPYVIFAMLMVLIGILYGIVMFLISSARGYFKLIDVLHVFIPFLIGIVVLVGGLTFSLLSPSNTPKNTASDRSEIIDNLPAVPSGKVVIHDNTLRPEHDSQERAKRFDDMVKY